MKLRALSNGISPIAAFTRAHPHLLQFALILCATMFLCAAAGQAATINVTSYGATGNGSTDDTTSINNAINASASGDTVLFPTGTYKITTNITFKSNRNYTGQGNAVLKQATANKFCASTENDNGINVLISGLTFQNGGVNFAGSGNVPANNVDITHCTFLNITNSTYPFNEAIYIPIGATGCDFTSNTFNNVMGDTGILTWDTPSCTFTDNYFTGVNEGMHLNGSNNANITIARNTGVNMHRMGIELQGSGYMNLLVEDNHFSHWVNPYNDSFGLSIVQGGAGTNSVINQYNTLLGRPAPATGRFGYGIEVGFDETCQYNFSEGYFWYGIIVGGANVTVKNNVVRGPTGNGLQPSTIAYEPGGDPNTTTITGNTQTNTASFIENPSSLTATIQNGDQVKLAWINNSSSQTGVEVQRHIPGGLYSVVATGLAATTATFTDDTAAPNTTYAYRIRVYDNSGNLTYSPAILAVTGAAVFQQFETENLTVAAQTSGVTERISTDARFSNDAGTFFDATTTSQFVTYDVPNVAAGTYDVRVGIKKWNNKGIWQLGISRMDQQGSPQNVGSPVDEYTSGETFTEVDLGNWTPASTSDKAFRFIVTGKNASSSGYGLAFDYIKLIPQ